MLNEFHSTNHRVRDGVTLQSDPAAWNITSKGDYSYKRMMFEVMFDYQKWLNNKYRLHNMFRTLRSYIYQQSMHNMHSKTNNWNKIPWSYPPVAYMGS